MSSSRSAIIYHPASGHQIDAACYNLWHACAGLSHTIPIAGQQIYYNLKGHKEQLEASMHNGSKEKLPKDLSVPDKVLCYVLDVQLQADPETEEVYADIILLPVQNQHEVSISCPLLPDPPSCVIPSFCHTITEVDCLTPSDASLKPPYGELVAYDIHGTQWRFSRTLEGQPTGWSEIVSGKKLHPGDDVIFLQEGNREELYVGVRRRMSETSAHFHVGLLYVASHAIATGSRFTVPYEPRKMQSPFHYQP